MSDTSHLLDRYGSVEELQVDDDFRRHMAERSFYKEHRVTISEILEVFDGRPSFFANGGSKRAAIIMVGPTTRGRILCIPLEPTGLFGVWRLVTAFEANASHRARYQEDQL